MSMALASRVLDDLGLTRTDFLRSEIWGGDEGIETEKALLQEGSKHGYQLIKDMTERSGGLYRGDV
jgi:hypothetical protein